MKAKILVDLKKGVLDPQGKAILHALQSLGFESIQDVRVGKIFEIELLPNAQYSQADFEKMAQKLLANTVIENYRVEPIEGEVIP